MIWKVDTLGGGGCLRSVQRGRAVPKLTIFERTYFLNGRPCHSQSNHHKDVSLPSSRFTLSP